MNRPFAVLQDGDDSEPPATLASFESVYADHAAAIHRFCLSQICDPDSAADLTHETFLKAFSAYHRVQPDELSVRMWLLRIARNSCIDFHRHNGRWRRLLLNLQIWQRDEDEVETVVLQHAELDRVNTAIARLRARERELIGLRVAGDLSYREIGEVMGIGEQAAKVATHRALTKLRNVLEDRR